MRLIQIIDNGIEELYKVNNDITNKMIKKYWKEYIKSDEDSFEDWLAQHSLSIGIERQFVEEIII